MSLLPSIKNLGAPVLCYEANREAAANLDIGTDPGRISFAVPLPNPVANLDSALPLAGRVSTLSPSYPAAACADDPILPHISRFLASPEYKTSYAIRYYFGSGHDLRSAGDLIGLKDHLRSKVASLQRTRPADILMNLENPHDFFVYLRSLDQIIQKKDPVNEANLLQVWPTVANQIDAPKLDSPDAIRLWIRENARVLSLVLRLDFSNLNLTMIPYEIIYVLEQCPALHCLNLSDNLLEELPQGFMEDSALECLDLKNNWIAHIPAKFAANMPFLAMLDMRDNRIAAVPAETIFEAPALRFLHLERNLITELPSAIASNVPYLELVALRGNSISELPLDFLPENHRLRKMILQNLALHQNILTKICCLLYEAIDKKCCGTTDMDY